MSIPRIEIGTEEHRREMWDHYMSLPIDADEGPTLWLYYIHYGTWPYRWIMILNLDWRMW